jgi:hypothetical protein
LSLFDDNEADVREAASQCFQYFTGETLEQYQKLVGRFLESRALESHGTSLLHALAQSTIHHGTITLTACEKAVIRASADGKGSYHHDLQDVKILVLRTYHQATDDGMRERSLDLIDRLIPLQVHGLEDAIQILESRR